MTAPVDQVQEEIAYLALHFHWSLDDLLDLEHPDRRMFVARAAQLLGTGGR